jgi:hypothetical protein
MTDKVDLWAGRTRLNLQEHHQSVMLDTKIGMGIATDDKIGAEHIPFRIAMS